MPRPRPIRPTSTGRYTVHGHPLDAECAIGFSFGYRGRREHPQPGASNEALAELAAGYYQLGIRPILQSLVDDALEARSLVGGYHRIERDLRTGQELGIRRAAEEALRLMRESGWRRALILAHAHQVALCDAVCRRLGIETIVPPGLGRVPFDPESSAREARSEREWIICEGPLIASYRDKGWT